MKKYLASTASLLLLSLTAFADSGSFYIDTLRTGTTTSSTLKVLNSSLVEIGTTYSGYFYNSGHNPYVTGWFQFSAPGPGTYYFELDVNGQKYRTNGMNFTSAGNGTFNSPPWVYNVEGFPNAVATDQVISGSLDVNGNNLSFGTHPSLPSTTPGFNWRFETTPFSGYSDITTRLRSIAGSSYYDWTWETPTGTRLMALSARPTPRLALTVPITINGANVLTAGASANVASFSTSGASAASGSAAIGAYSSAGGSYGLAVGYGAQTGSGTYAAVSLGTQTIANGSNSTAIGIGITSFNDQVVVGKYNDTSTAGTSVDGVNHTQGVFIVGAGSGSTATERKNAIRVTNSGVVLIRPSGDLLMGDGQGNDFTVGERP